MEKREEYLKQFELKLRCETNSNDTVRNYVPAVRRFLDFCKGKKDKPETLLQNYMVGTLENYAPKSINLHRAAVVKFFEMVLGINLTVRDVPSYTHVLPASAVSCGGQERGVVPRREKKEKCKTR